MDDNVDTVSPHNETYDQYNTNIGINYTNYGTNNLYKGENPTNKNINKDRITDTNQDNLINNLLRLERMTTRSMNKVLISGGTSTKDNINIPKSFKQSWNNPEMSERVFWREEIRDEIKN